MKYILITYNISADTLKSSVVGIEIKTLLLELPCLSVSTGVYSSNAHSHPSNVNLLVRWKGMKDGVKRSKGAFILDFLFLEYLFTKLGRCEPG